jgi:hypothetical protein
MLTTKNLFRNFLVFIKPEAHMTQLTTCKAMQYAVFPTSATFENLSQKCIFPRASTEFENRMQGCPGYVKVSELQMGRCLFYGGFVTASLAVGVEMTMGAEMMALGNPSPLPFYVIISSFALLAGSTQLYYAAKRIQGLWELQRIAR